MDAPFYYGFISGLMFVMVISLIYVGIVETMQQKKEHREWIKQQYGSLIPPEDKKTPSQVWVSQQKTINS